MSDSTAPISAQERDAQLRRRMLNVARLQRGAYQNGFVPFVQYLAARDDEGSVCRNDDHAELLLSSLVEWGCLEEFAAIAQGGARRTLRDRRWRLTTKGYELWTRTIDPIPGIADDRLL